MVESPKAADEIQAISSFLCDRHPEIFRKESEESLGVADPREAIVLASNVRDSFFLRPSEAKGFEAFGVDLDREFSSPWALDYQREYPEAFEGKKAVRFFPHWVPMAGYSGKGAEYRTRRREKEMLDHLGKELKEEGMEPPDVLFVPYYWYSKGGRRFGEQVYHYLSGLVFREMGYLVFDEYSPTFVTGTGRTPDVSAFRTPEVVELLAALRAKGIIASGAFQQELQLFSIFGKRPSHVANASLDLTDAESVAIEVKRSESEKGWLDLAQYLGEAYGFYDEGYLAAPLVQGEGVLSFDREGRLVFGRDTARHHADPLSEPWAEKRGRQMLDVRGNAMLQLLKNLPLSRILSTSGGEGLRTYIELSASWEGLDAGVVIDALQSVR